MKGAESITAAIRIANQAGRPAMVAFLTAGFPERARFGEHLLEIAAEADFGKDTKARIDDLAKVNKRELEKVRNGTTRSFFPL